MSKQPRVFLSRVFDLFILISTTLFVLMTGCTLEPRYQRPSMEMPCAWRIETDEGTTLCNARWWESLGDPILNALIVEALENNRDLKVAIARVYEYFGRYEVAQSPLFPQIGLGATALKEKLPERTSFVPQGFDPITPFYAYELTVSYELDFWGKLRSQAHAAYAEALESIENRRTVVVTLVSSVAQAYIYLRELDRELVIGYETLEERKEYLKLARIRFEGGLTSEIEVMQAQSLFDQTLAEVVLLEEAIPQQENLISVLIGTNPTCILRGREINTFNFPCEIPAGLPSDLLCRRPDIRAAEDRLVAANAEIGVARAAFFPQINLTALYGGESFQLKDLFSPASRAWHIGATFFQPLFTGGKLSGQLKIAWAQRYEALFSYEQTVLNAFKEVNDALVAMQQSKKLIAVDEDEVGANRQYLYLSWLRYYNGQTDYLTVLDAEQRLFEAQINLTQAQGNLYSSLVALYKALGGGWVIDADITAVCYK